MASSDWTDSGLAHSPQNINIDPIDDRNSAVVEEYWSDRPSCTTLPSSVCLTDSRSDRWYSRQHSTRSGRFAASATNAVASECVFADPRPP